MSAPSQKDNEKHNVGDISPSHLLFSSGVGAIVDLPELSVMVMGLEGWPEAPEYMHEIVEDRLLHVVRGVIGHQLKRFLTPPTVTNTGAPISPFDMLAKVGVPVATFPRWMVCPSCQYLGALGSGLFELKHNPFHPDRTHYVHSTCNKIKQPTVVPARFLAACEKGHLDDFPWIEFVHGNVGNCQGPLRLYERTPSGEARDLIVECQTCKVSRQLAEAFGESNRDKMPICRGRRPHLRDYDSEGCEHRMRPIVLGASNMWFPVVFSSIAVPTVSAKLNQVVQDNWAVLQNVTSQAILVFMRNIGQLGSLVDYPDDQILEAIEQRKQELGEAEGNPQEAADLKDPEWQAFTEPNPDTYSADFRLRPVAIPDAYSDAIRNVVLVERMREVRAMAGFTRLDSPGELSEPGADNLANIAPLSRKAPQWVPAIEIRGEGIFVRFNEDQIQVWFKKPGVSLRNDLFFSAHKNWRQARYIEDTAAYYPGIRYVLLHTFAHVLIRQLAMESGYNTASLRDNLKELSVYNRNPESRNLIEIMPITLDDGKNDVYRAVREFRTRVHSVFQCWLSSVDVDMFVTVLSEVCQNIFMHSGSTGYVALQTYHFQGKNTITLAVCDLGVGIKASLSEQYPDLDFASTSQYLHTALFSMPHSRQRFHYGLTKVRDIVQDWCGSIFIRSCDASVLVSPEFPAGRLADGRKHFPGTQIMIQVSG